MITKDELLTQLRSLESHFFVAIKEALNYEGEYGELTGPELDALLCQLSMARNGILTRLHFLDPYSLANDPELLAMSTPGTKGNHPFEDEGY
jgi:hypothetical protein